MLLSQFGLFLWQTDMAKRHCCSYKEFKSIYALPQSSELPSYLKSAGDEAGSVSGCCIYTMMENLQILNSHLPKHSSEQEVQIQTYRYSKKRA